MPRSVASAKARAIPAKPCVCGHAKQWHEGWYKLSCKFPGCVCREYGHNPYDRLYETPTMAAVAFWSQFR